MYPKITNTKGFPYIHIWRLCWGRGQGEKRPRKTESVFRFRFNFPTEKPTNKSRFSIGKTDKKPTEKNEFRVSVHNTADSRHPSYIDHLFEHLWSFFSVGFKSKNCFKLGIVVVWIPVEREAPFPLPIDSRPLLIEGFIYLQTTPTEKEGLPQALGWTMLNHSAVPFNTETNILLPSQSRKHEGAL